MKVPVSSETSVTFYQTSWSLTRLPWR